MSSYTIAARVSAAALTFALTIAACTSADDRATKLPDTESASALTFAQREVDGLTASSSGVDGVLSPEFGFDTAAQNALNTAIDQFAPEPPLSMAGVVVDVSSGLIVAAASSSGDSFVGIDEQHDSGSTLKLVVLSAAIAAGAIPDDGIIVGENCNGPSVPRFVREDDSEGVVISIARATELSSDCGFLKLTRMVGPRRLADAARRLGIDRELDLGSQFAVGANTVSMRELAQALSVLLSGGLSRSVHAVTSWTNRDGGTASYPTDPTRKFPTSSANHALAAISGVTSVGTAAGTAIDGHQTYGKTGTARSSSSVWFVGGTSDYISVIWAGDPTSQGRSLNGTTPDRSQPVTGGNYAARAWNEVMKPLHPPRLEPTSPPVEVPDRDPVVLVDVELDCTNIEPQSPVRSLALPHLAPGTAGLGCAPNDS